MNNRDQAANISLLDRFYGTFALVGLVLLAIGVPFVFYRKAASAGVLIVLIAVVLAARQLSRSGRPQLSLEIFSGLLLLAMIGLLYLGQTPITAVVAMAIAVMLSVIVSMRSGILFGATFMLGWLSYIVVDALGLAPPKYFVGTPLTAWFIGAVSVWVVLLPVPELIASMRSALALAAREAATRAAAEAALIESETKLKQAQRIAEIGSWELDLVRNELTWSDEIYRIFEIDRASFDPSYEAFLKLVHPDDREKVDEAYRRSVRDKLPYEVEHRLLFEGGRIKYVRERCETHYGEGGKALRSAGTVQDITDTRLNEEALRESERHFREIMEHAPIGMALATLDGRLALVNHAFCKMLGYSKAELEQLSFEAITYAEDRDTVQDYMSRLLDGRIPDYQMEKRYIRKDGQLVWAQLTASLLRSADKAPTYVLGQIEDITASKMKREQIEHRAYYDALTDLPNRRLLLDRLSQALAIANRNQNPLALLFLDLDRFKDINDTLGHDVGDEILRKVAARLKACVRRGDTVSRLGGDEFIVVMAELDQPQHASLVSEKIIEALSHPINAGGRALTIGTSIGIAIYPDDASEDGYELIKKADKAMYAAKDAGRNCYRYYRDGAVNLTN